MTKDVAAQIVVCRLGLAFCAGLFVSCATIPPALPIVDAIAYGLATFAAVAALVPLPKP